MIYKRATKLLVNAGIDHIVIEKSLWGPAPSDTRARSQTSRCYPSWEEAAKAVIDGYRPRVLEWRVGLNPNLDSTKE